MPQKNGLKLSFEFFPVSNADQERRFWRTVGALETLEPEFFSLTCGALGAKRDVCNPLLRRLARETDVPVIAHQTCYGLTENQLESELTELDELGIAGVVALRGDLPEDARLGQDSDFRHADQLVKLAAGRFSQSRGKSIYVAAYPEVHPEAAGARQDLEVLKHKFDQGAKAAITQFFYFPDQFLRFRDQARDIGIGGKIIPGILPIHDIEKVVRFAERCQASLPPSVVDEFRVWAHDEEATRELSVAHCVALCETLRREGVDHFHFYTLNNSDLAHEVSGLLYQSAKADASVMSAA